MKILTRFCQESVGTELAQLRDYLRLAGLSMNAIGAPRSALIIDSLFAFGFVPSWLSTHGRRT